MNQRTKDVLKLIACLLLIPIAVGIFPMYFLKSTVLTITFLILVGICFYWQGRLHGWSEGHIKGHNQGFIDGYYTSVRGESIPSFIDIKQVYFPPHEKMFPPEPHRRRKPKDPPRAT